MRFRGDRRGQYAEPHMAEEVDAKDRKKIPKIEGRI